MKDDVILSTLEEAARSMSIKIQYDDLRKGEVNTAGGLFRLKDETRILIHKGLTTEEKVDKLLTLFASLDTETIHLPPAVRKRLEATPVLPSETAGKEKGS